VFAYLAAKKTYNVGMNQFKISRKDVFNQKQSAYFRWFKTDAQELHLAKSISENLLYKSELFSQEIRVFFEIGGEGEYSLFLIFTRKSDTFYDVKLTKFVKSSKLTQEEQTITSVPLVGYTFDYKLVPPESAHYHTTINSEEFKCRLYFSSHIIFKKERFFKKYNFQRLASDLMKYIDQNNLIDTLSDGTPIFAKAKPSNENDSVNHTLQVMCSLWYNEKSTENTKYVFYIDGIRYLSPFTFRQNIYCIGKIFELPFAKTVEIKPRPNGLKIVKKKLT